ncbi:MAG: hypothetical protein ACR2PW_07605 [Gammaproteobacteria bacterium]
MALKLSLAEAQTPANQFTACHFIPMEKGLGTRDLLQRFKLEANLETQARKSAPYFCIDKNKFAYGLYVADSKKAPLGVSIRKHFHNHADFIWIEKSSPPNSPTEKWAAVVVIENLAIEEALHASKEEVRALVKGLTQSVDIIVTERESVEPWIKSAFSDSIDLNWISLGVTALRGAYGKAITESLDVALITAKLKWQIRPSILIGFIVTVMASLASYLFFDNAGTRVTPIQQITQGATQTRENLWLDNAASNVQTQVALTQIYDLLLDAWALNLDVTEIELSERNLTIHLKETPRTRGEETLLTTWAEYRNLKLRNNKLLGKLQKGDFIAISPETIQKLHRGEADFFATEEIQILDANYDLTNLGKFVQKSAALNKLTLHEIQFQLKTFDQMIGLQVLAQDPILQKTYLKKLDFPVNSKNFTISAAFNMQIGGWKAL